MSNTYIVYSSRSTEYPIVTFFIHICQKFFQQDPKVMYILENISANPTYLAFSHRSANIAAHHRKPVAASD